MGGETSTVPLHRRLQRICGRVCRIHFLVTFTFFSIFVQVPLEGVRFKARLREVHLQTIVDRATTGPNFVYVPQFVDLLTTICTGTNDAEQYMVKEHQRFVATMLLSNPDLASAARLHLYSEGLTSPSSTARRMSLSNRSNAKVPKNVVDDREELIKDGHQLINEHFLIKGPHNALSLGVLCNRPEQENSGPQLAFPGVAYFRKAQNDQKEGRGEESSVDVYARYRYHLALVELMGALCEGNSAFIGKICRALYGAAAWPAEALVMCCWNRETKPLDQEKTLSSIWTFRAYARFVASAYLSPEAEAESEQRAAIEAVSNKVLRSLDSLLKLCEEYIYAFVDCLKKMKSSAGKHSTDGANVCGEHFLCLRSLCLESIPALLKALLTTHKATGRLSAHQRMIEAIFKLLEQVCHEDGVM